ncbi:hypothetical protein K443DRAFT_102282 [Laccaria amethystina LaAM-08-1]|uniref:Sister chromatid cohesion protein DCC1 n=1 Tax=Laccaria amethystina LaAM-08-1 TaxID=1095629 RepID=A0A0C9XP87_9AGAR|nr:hypothetical protein K443DRAFT_102282 [Laccaria amethystina LaAM-08-1]
MQESCLSFSPISSEEAGFFKLLELTPELVTLIEEGTNKYSYAPSLIVKGQPGEDAVICTVDKTYSMRTVDLSNSVLVITPPPDAFASKFTDTGVVIRDQLNEIIELAPIVPKLHKLSTLLRGREYDDEEHDEDASSVRFRAASFTYQDARELIQASDAELNRGLRERRILNINGNLRPISLTYLNQLLELVLNLLVSLSQPHTCASVEDISSALANGHEVPRVVSAQVMSWFGDIHQGKWKIDVDCVIREVGLGILRNHKQEPVAKDIFVAKWTSLVGDSFEHAVSLPLLAVTHLSSLLQGNYLVSTIQDKKYLTYFPASLLPIDPAARFSTLFLTCPRWKGDEILPFLSDIAVNNKERDKLLLKHCRAITDSEGVWYTARAQYNG